jgi:8-oxo-dGTP diphosphatase
MVENKCDDCGSDLDEYGRRLPQKSPEGYLNPSLASDAAVIKYVEAKLQILLIRRAEEPSKGLLAFPGGFVDYNEDPKDAAIRELSEECGIRGRNPRLIDLRGDPSRDSRKHVVSAFYYVEVDDFETVVAGDDASSADYYFAEELLRNPDWFGSDHYSMLQKLLNWLESNSSFI